MWVAAPYVTCSPFLVFHHAMARPVLSSEKLSPLPKGQTNGGHTPHASGWLKGIQLPLRKGRTKEKATQPIRYYPGQRKYRIGAEQTPQDSTGHTSSLRLRK